MDLEELKNLHHLLDGYMSILYRLNEDSIEEIKFDKWVHDAQSSRGRSDRVRSKLTSAEAMIQLRNLDAIFPLYEKYFNTSDAKESSNIIVDIGDRVHNVELTLAKLEGNFGNGVKKNECNLIILLTISVSMMELAPMYF